MCIVYTMISIDSLNVLFIDGSISIIEGLLFSVVVGCKVFCSWLQGTLKEGIPFNHGLLVNILNNYVGLIIL